MSASPTRVYEFGPFRLDPRLPLLTRGGEPVPLQPKALETLVALVERGGRVVSRDELVAVVWPDAEVEENNLSVNVSLLRKALGEAEGGGRYIETVQRRGYRFTAPVSERPVESHELLYTRHTRSQVLIEESQEGEATPAVVVPALAPRATPETSPAVASVTRRGRSAFVAAAVILLLAIGGFGVRYLGNRSSNAAQIESIAVLPFDNESADADVEYLSDGMTETLINSLSQLPNLNVKARSSVFRYKGKVVAPEQVGNELSVQAVLTGRVVQHGDELMLSLELVDARTGNQMWGERYGRKLTDLVSLQSEIARDVANKLRARLSGADEQRVTRRYTDNAQAYQLYLKGNFYASQYTKEGLSKGIAYFNQALAEDPNYALAYNGLAYYYIVAVDWYLSPQDSMPKAREAAKRALAFDESLADAHASLAVVLYWHDWDWAAAEREYRRAIELNPGDARARQFYSIYLAHMGRPDEAITEAKRAQQLDPISLGANTYIGIILLFADREDEAVEQLRKTVEMDSTFWLAHAFLGRAFEQKGDINQAMAEYRRARQLEENVPELLALVGRAYALSGKKAEAQKVIEELKELSKGTHVPPYNFAIIYAGLGNKDEAFAWLDRAYTERSYYLTWLKVDSQMDGLRSDPRFDDLLRRVGLTP